jgi:signal transduction histidine kinase
MSHPILPRSIAGTDVPPHPAALLHALAAALTVAATPEEVSEVVVTIAVASFAAAGGVVALISDGGDELEIVRTSAMPRDIEAAWQRFPLSDPVPIAEAARTGEPIFIESREHWCSRYPGIAPLLEATGHHAVMTLPLVAGGRIVGTMGLSFAAPRLFTEDDRALARSAAHLCAQALERARLFAAERRARGAAEASAARLSLLYEEAQAANRAKDDFLAMVSHELRSPLAGIGNNVQMLAMEICGPLTDKQRAALARISSSQEHLLGLIEQLLDLKQMAAGHMRYESRPVQLDEVLTAAAAMMEWQFERSRVEFVTEMPAAGVVVSTDGGKLKQIVVNLLSNAAKFTPSGGSVTLARLVDGDSVRVEVRDTGIGIDAAQLEAVFQPFVQVRDGRQPNIGGTGLGLAISREFARGMGGELDAESEVGVGSRFTLTLPKRARDTSG